MYNSSFNSTVKVCQRKSYIIKTKEPKEASRAQTDFSCVGLLMGNCVQIDADGHQARTVASQCSSAASTGKWTSVPAVSLSLRSAQTDMKVCKK